MRPKPTGSSKESHPSPQKQHYYIYNYNYTHDIQPTLTYGAHSIHVKKTDLQLLEKAYARIIKTSLGLFKFSKTNPLLTALKTQRLESVVKVQNLNLLRRCMSGDSLALMFYWTIYKRGDTEGTH